MEQKIVAHLKQGAIHKGVTHDFQPNDTHFHLLPAEGGGVPLRIEIDSMKAIFYVKDYIGNREFTAQNAFNTADLAERKAVVTFRDGEEIWGYLAQDEKNEGTGFFFYPAEKEDNNIRIFVVRSAIDGKAGVEPPAAAAA